MLPLVWKTLFLTAKKLNVQIFATTHSWDCVEAFQQAVSHHPEEGILLRLSNKGSQVIPTIFDAEELKIATREHIEVR